MWGYRPELYAYTRMPAAARFLESQPLSGVFADRHLFESSASYPEWAEKNRRELVRTRPDWVVDGLALYNPRLAITEYADLREWLSGYREVARIGRTIVYRRG